MKLHALVLIMFATPAFADTYLSKPIEALDKLVVDSTTGEIQGRLKDSGKPCYASASRQDLQNPQTPNVTIYYYNLSVSAASTTERDSGNTVTTLIALQADVLENTANRIKLRVPGEIGNSGSDWLLLLTQTDAVSTIQATSHGVFVFDDANVECVLN